ncbi:Helix-turn-helix domain-containing protein [Nocardia amikacinitolerans]|uniref:Helix-turn-helix domain-containing protein n=1 Tax=Nocardia amikacinitolerans TaxID=756689 RepID=A0A285KVL1_9NOCA|nr:helix-turn-helix transcriptional regulator [Nocardia amikacinitolerans]MCP2294251.1 Helix-turn-helix domain-containing protein [Nocardia amikacinitolerans]SNY76702.1 Helix-turn-helix domain-containing protein [Nocardia amikacinitolerans]
MDDRTELSEFLKSRRARLRPEDVRLRDYGGVRRVAGLRREELARVAGVSIAHYTRLEQGRSESVSNEALNAIGAALRLDTDELAYLHRIARRPTPCAQDTPSPDALAGLRYLLKSFVMTPALLIGKHTQIVGWNELAVAVFGDFPALPEDRRTLSHLLFTEPYLRDLHRAEWARAAREHVAHLRVLLGRYRGDRELAAHIDRMRDLSTDFARMWAEHQVARFRSGIYVLDHPIAGELTLHRELVSLPDAPSCCGLDLFAAEPGSPSERALRRLGDRLPVAAD